MITSPVLDDVVVNAEVIQDDDFKLSRLSEKITKTMQIEPPEHLKSDGKGSKTCPVTDRVDRSDFNFSGDMDVISNWNDAKSCAESENYRVTIKTCNTADKNMPERDTIKVSNTSRSKRSLKTSNTGNRCSCLLL
jgi:hypothetical protein